MTSILYLTFLLLINNGIHFEYTATATTEISYLPTNELIEYHGRTEKINENTVALIGSASSATMAFKGTSCELMLSSENRDHNYVNLELDGTYLGRFKIENQGKPFKVDTESETEIHHLTVFKATEAASGSILFEGIKAEEVVALETSSKKTIEFIGNSITCGALSDASQMPCEEGEYLDHHNAYLAYGPRVARALNVNFVLSSVSGIGIYRNWNDEHIEQPIMPEVYKNLYLDTNVSKPYLVSTQPDLVSICLGTNDLSDGDGQKERLPFNAEKFTGNYIEFVDMIFRRYPNTTIVLLNSPMVFGEKNDILVSCLQKVRSHFTDHDIRLFEFEKLYVNGCSYHPSTEDHAMIANHLTPVFKGFLDDE